MYGSVYGPLFRDRLDAHVAKRFQERFGLAVGWNEIVYLEQEILSGSHKCVGVQEAIDPGNGQSGHRERHIYHLAMPGTPEGRPPVPAYLVWDPMAKRVVSVLPPGWRWAHSKDGRGSDGRVTRKDPRDDAYQGPKSERRARRAVRVSRG